MSLGLVIQFGTSPESTELPPRLAAIEATPPRRAVCLVRGGRLVVMVVLLLPPALDAAAVPPRPGPCERPPRRAVCFLAAAAGFAGVEADDDGARGAAALALGLDAAADAGVFGLAAGVVVGLADGLAFGVIAVAVVVVVVDFVVFAFLAAAAAELSAADDFVDFETLMSTPPTLTVRSIVSASALRFVPPLLAAAVGVLLPSRAFLASRSLLVHCFFRSASRARMRGGTATLPARTAS